MSKNESIFTLFDKVFDEEWHFNVISATSIAILFEKDDEKITPLADYILHWNIIRTLKEQVLPNLINVLPTSLDWTDIDPVAAFDIINTMIESCSLCPTFKKYSVKIKTGDYNPFNKNFKLWKGLIENEFPNLRLSLRTNSINCQTLSISAIPQNKKPATE